jgi:hypothetical protein
MTTPKLQSLVTDAVKLDRQIAELADQLKELKEQIITQAEARQEEATPTEGGGTALVFEGLDGCVARVNMPAPSLKSKIDGEGRAIEKIRQSAGRFFDKLFRPAISYAPVERFRDEAAALLGRQASQLIRLCETKSSPRVSFETKEPA